MFKKIACLIVFTLVFSVVNPIAFAENGKEPTIWQSVRKNFRMEYDPNRAEIKKQIKLFTKNSDDLYDTLKKAGPMIYYIAKLAEQNDMPSELALIPIIESDYDPSAKTSSGAAGLWQFMPQTAHEYGLQINQWYDDRFDVLKSTRSAFNYYNYLNDFFDGNWTLAMAAYDTGEGKVLNAIRFNERHGRPTHFWSLDLPQETRVYIPKLLALVSIIKNPEQYGIHLPYVKAKQYFQEVNVPSHTPMSVVANLSSANMKTIRSFNSGYKKGETGPRHDNHLLLPADKASNLKVAQSHDRDKPLHQTTVAKHSTVLAAKNESVHYKIKQGDSLVTIAHRYHTSVKQLRNINGIRRNTIVAGHILTIR